jgi:hypothetical protein
MVSLSSQRGLSKKVGGWACSGKQLGQKPLKDGATTILLFTTEAPLAVDWIVHRRLSTVIALSGLVLQKTLAACVREVGARHWSPPRK